MAGGGAECADRAADQPHREGVDVQVDEVTENAESEQLGGPLFDGVELDESGVLAQVGAGAGDPGIEALQWSPHDAVGRHPANLSEPAAPQHGDRSRLRT
ncbi:hypothetical protein MOBUDSM44075_00092 [Mycolicibacterium obuense]|uniref:Uncharacterized protein n=1 Tax=Mycolicibacterium obuense TaxID=1807 RepID=A0A0J6WFE8_9MYCO|nr:hypothetical protein MOBUDSM44075_00092 [Mycolicibacterium obuense]